MLSSGKIAGLFDNQYLKKETIIVMNSLHKDSYQEQICAWFCVAWCTQSRPDSPRVVMGKFGWFEGSLATF